MDDGIRFRARADRRVQSRIMRDDDDSILGDAHIEFEHIDTLCNGVLKSRHGIFRANGAGSTVAVHLDLSRRGQAGQTKDNQNSGPHES